MPSVAAAIPNTSQVNKEIQPVVAVVAVVTVAVVAVAIVVVVVVEMTHYMLVDKCGCVKGAVTSNIGHPCPHVRKLQLVV